MLHTSQEATDFSSHPHLLCETERARVLFEEDRTQGGSHPVAWEPDLGLPTNGPGSL